MSIKCAIKEHKHNWKDDRLRTEERARAHKRLGRAKEELQKWKKKARLIESGQNDESRVSVDSLPVSKEEIVVIDIGDSEEEGEDGTANMVIENVKSLPRPICFFPTNLGWPGKLLF